MGENNLKPIVGRSPILEQKRIREDELRRRQRRAANAKRRKRQQRKRLAMLAVLLCVIAFGIAAIVKLASDIGGSSQGETSATGTNADSQPYQEADVSALGITDADYKYDCKDTAILEKLQEKAENNQTIKFIYDNYKAYPEDLLKAVSNNNELIDFAVKYPVEIKKEQNRVLTVEGLYTPGEMPLFIQWDDKWGYYPYGEDVMGISGCGPTCLSMVMVALTGKNQYTPTAIADFAMDNGYYYSGAGTAWEIFNEGVKKLGLNSRTLGLSENAMINALNNGEYLILSMAPGIFTSVGHYIVVYDYQDGKFLIKDPNSRIRSNTAYSYDEIQDQIKNIWAISN